MQEEDAVVKEEGAEVATEQIEQVNTPYADDQVTAVTRNSGLTNSISTI